MNLRILCLMAGVVLSAIGGVQAKSTDARRVLVVYFSHTGNTRAVAMMIHDRAGGDVFEIVPVRPYPAEYDSVVAQAKRELDAGFKPPLKGKVKDIRSYDVIFVGYPNWWSSLPPPVATFLSAYDLSGKTVVPFCTHGSGGLGHTVADLTKLCPKSTVLEALSVRGTDAKKSQDAVSAWLKRLNLLKQGGHR